MDSIPAYNEYAHRVLMPAMDQHQLALVQQLEAEHRTEDPRYMQTLVPMHYEQHFLRRPFAEWPEPVSRSFGHLNQHVYELMQGPSELGASGRLVEWNRSADLHRITVHLSTVAAGHEPFALHLRGTGTFRPLTEVVFVAVAEGIGDCERIAAAVRELPAVDRPLRYSYHPHVTVAQDVSPDALDAVFSDLADFEAKFMVSGFTLFEHGRDGRWRPHREYRLGDGAVP